MRPEPEPEQHPWIVAVDPDPTTRMLLVDELDDRYGRHYNIVIAASSEEAVVRLRDGAHADVALVLADRGHDGALLLSETRSLHPHAKRVLLIGWNEHRSAREEIVEVLRRGEADYYVARPTTRPDERFHRAMSEFLDDWWRLRGRPFKAVRVIGDGHSPRAHEICDLLHRHDFPYAFDDLDSDAGRDALEAAAVNPTSAPVVIVEGRAPLVDPTNLDVAEALGARTRPGEGTYDVVVIGGGPAGLATAVYAGSEGLRVALVERTSMGGQAGTSSMIRNYLGFPGGISGAELARRAFDQAILFGTEMVYGGDVVDVRADGDLRVVELADGATLATRTVVIATGVAYRTLDVPSLEAFNGVGVHYGSDVRGTSDHGRARLRRRRRQLRRPSSDAPRRVRQVGDDRREIEHARREHVRLPREEHRTDAEHRHPLRDRDRGRRWRRSPRVARPRGPHDRGCRTCRSGSVVRPHRRRPVHGLASTSDPA
jgi:thioredoxin reductase (NADPH)